MHRNKFAPVGFKEENFHADGTWELRGYNLNGTLSPILMLKLHQTTWTSKVLSCCALFLAAGPAFAKSGQSFTTTVSDSFARAQRRAYCELRFKCHLCLGIFIGNAEIMDNCP